MDLREKPGKVQKLLEILMRIRLLSVVGLVVATVALLVSHWRAVVALPAAASESLGIWMSEFSMDKLMDSGRYLTVTAVASVILFSVFGKVRGLLSSLFAVGLSLGAIFMLGDVGENVGKPMIFLGILAIVSLVGILFSKLSVFCGLFPFVLSWIFFSALVAMLQPSLEPAFMTWAVLSTLGFAGAMSLSTVAGKHLSEGMPQGGAVSRAAKQMVLPVVATSVMAVCALAFDMPAENGVRNVQDCILFATLYFFLFNLWFFVILFPVMTFAPWDRLRSGSRRVEMKDKKKPSTKGKKK